MALIEISGLGKAYKQYRSQWGRMVDLLAPFMRPQCNLLWVLQDVSFSVERGEAIGIVGMNGAGKSTLLKIIAGTTLPTTGTVHVRGTVAALLELGMGFHADFTGRQNAITACQLLGISNAEIQELLPRIEDFAEIGAFFEQPLRTYSSGMQMRLAFAVATARRPDILIVDEALSVGDSYFQHKSFSRIRQFREEGTTLLIVSHDRSAIQGVCDRVVLLSEGRVAQIGTPEETMNYYHALMSEVERHLIKSEKAAYGRAITISGNGAATVEDIRLIDSNGQSSDVAVTGTWVNLEIMVHVREDLEALVVGIMLRDRLGQAIYGISSYRLGLTIEKLSAGERLVCRFSFQANLGKGNYSVTTGLTKGDSHLHDCYEWRDGGFVFSVVNTQKPDFVGCTSLDAEFSFDRSGRHDPDAVKHTGAIDAQ